MATDPCNAQRAPGIDEHSLFDSGRALLLPLSRTYLGSISAITPSRPDGC
jgi:hypothetical protein